MSKRKISKPITMADLIRDDIRAFGIKDAAIIAFEERGIAIGLFYFVAFGKRRPI